MANNFKTLFSLFFLLIVGLGKSQTWEVEVYYVDKQHLEVKVQPNYDYNSEYSIEFPQGILTYNEKSEFSRIDESSLELEKVESTFVLNANHSKFSYKVDLSDSTHMANHAYLDYGSIQVANWKEILFNADKEVSLNINFHKEEQVYELGVNNLSAWKANPSKIVPMKSFVVVNNVSCYSNLANEDLGNLLEVCLENFDLYQRPIDLILIFGADSLNTSGAFYSDLAIVYVDAKTSGGKPNFTIQQQVLKQLYIGVSPYGIYPEEELRNIGQNWLAEATPEYLSLKFMLHNDLISSEEFLELMEDKMRLTTKYFGTSLEIMSKEVYRQSDYLQAFSSKGCIASWLLDLRLFEITNGAVASEDLIFGNFNALDDETQLLVSDALFEMEKDLVGNAEDFPMNAYLNPFGLKYELEGSLPLIDNNDPISKEGPQISVDKSASNEQKTRWQRFASE